MIKLKFNEIKTVQAVSIFLKKNNGIMNYTKLIKLLYLTDRESLKLWGITLTGDSYFAMERGPILSNVLDNIHYGKSRGQISYWHKYISDPENYNISLKHDPGYDELSKREIDLIDEIYQKYKKYDQWKMIDICHEILPEWEDPGNTSIPIRIEDILKVVCKTERDIAIIEQDIEDQEYFNFLLSKKTA
jgi:uncharacterized phage-associated protein